jgi:hypothetical protein
VTAEEFFRCSSNRTWLGRGKDYRLLAEQLDIVNWYYTNKHISNNAEYQHYCNGLVDDANNLVEYHLVNGSKAVKKSDKIKRPDRYSLIQQQELLAPYLLNPKAGEGKVPASSLKLARLLKIHLTRQDGSGIPFEQRALWKLSFDRVVGCEKGAQLQCTFLTTAAWLPFCGWQLICVGCHAIVFVHGYTPGYLFGYSWISTLRLLLASAVNAIRLQN